MPCMREMTCRTDPDLAKTPCLPGPTSTRPHCDEKIVFPAHSVDYLPRSIHSLFIWYEYIYAVLYHITSPIFLASTNRKSIQGHIDISQERPCTTPGIKTLESKE